MIQYNTDPETQAISLMKAGNEQDKEFKDFVDKFCYVTEGWIPIHRGQYSLVSNFDLTYDLDFLSSSTKAINTKNKKCLLIMISCYSFIYIFKVNRFLFYIY